MQGTTARRLERWGNNFIIFFGVASIVSFFFFIEHSMFEKRYDDSFHQYVQFLDDAEFRDLEVRIVDGLTSYGDAEMCGVYVQNYCNGSYMNVNPDCFDDVQRMHETVYHEYAHHVHACALTDHERVIYKNIYSTASEYVSDYAFEAGVGEDFAESYVAYRMYGERSGRRAEFFSNMTRKYGHDVV